MRILAILLTTLVPPGMLVAQTAGQWSAPTLGYLFDTESRSLRAIQGVPGAASVEEGLAFDAKLQSATVDPGRRYAILRLREGGVVWAALRAPGSRNLETDASEFVLSPSGNSGLFYDSAHHRAQVWTGLASEPVMSRDFELQAFQAAAISDDARMIAVADENGLRLIDGDAFTVLSSSNGIKSLAFKSGSYELAAGDTSTDQVLYFKRDGAETEARALASSQDGVGQPVGVAFSADGTKVIAANSRGRSVVTIHLASESKRAVACECEPATLARAQGDAVFQISRPEENLVYFFDGDSAEPRVFPVLAGGAR